MKDPICTPRSLPENKRVAAAKRAVEINPANHPHTPQLTRAMRGTAGTGRKRLAVEVLKRWPASGVRLTVGFLDNPPADLRKRILLHMNAWAKTANVRFTETKGRAQVRIARLDHPEEDAGYWSYIGTEILSIPAKEPTMNLDSFTMKTEDSEFHRVVRHETGHTLGFPHEHMRRQLVQKIDVAKAIKYFRRTQGWSAAETRDQVLTPIEESSLLGTPKADPKSIMCYQLPGAIMKNGKAILGGTDIDASDFAFVASIYPKKLA